MWIFRLPDQNFGNLLRVGGWTIFKNRLSSLKPYTRGMSHLMVFRRLLCHQRCLLRRLGGLVVGRAWEVKKVEGETHHPGNSISTTGIFTAVLNSKMSLKVWVKFQLHSKEISFSSRFHKNICFALKPQDATQINESSNMLSEVIPAGGLSNSDLPYRGWALAILFKESVKRSPLAMVPIFLRIPPFKSFVY